MLKIAKCAIKINLSTFLLTNKNYYKRGHFDGALNKFILRINLRIKYILNLNRAEELNIFRIQYLWPFINRKWH